MLCDLVNGCNFFTFEEQLGDCYLKYGVGEKKSKSNTFFGHKKPQGGGNSKATKRIFWECQKPMFFDNLTANKAIHSTHT